jgi:4,5-DOPA dioxygenase extradiol
MQSIHIDHGNPMNAILDNTYTQAIKNLGQSLWTPDTIIILSAHWLTGENIEIWTSPNPPMIYDMSGFPDELYRVQYSVRWDVEWGKDLWEFLHTKGLPISFNPTHGIDHGVWSILKHLFPDANIPIIPISVAYHQWVEYQYKIGGLIREFCEWKNILFISSGNIVHNLSRIDWTHHLTPDWARDFDANIENHIKKREYHELVEYSKFPNAILSVPTPDHFYPFLTFLGTLRERSVESVFHGFELGSISTRIYKML